MHDAKFETRGVSHSSETPYTNRRRHDPRKTRTDKCVQIRSLLSRVTNQKLSESKSPGLTQSGAFLFSCGVSGLAPGKAHNLQKRVRFAPPLPFLAGLVDRKLCRRSIRFLPGRTGFNSLTVHHVQFRPISSADSEQVASNHQAGSSNLPSGVRVCSCGVNWMSPNATNVLPARGCRFESCQEYQVYGWLAQLDPERLIPNQEAGGSSPLPPSISF